MDYHCTNCTRTFDGFAAANNHEKKTEYKHLPGQPAKHI